MHQSRQQEAVWIMPGKIHCLFFKCAASPVKHRFFFKNDEKWLFAFCDQDCKNY